MKAEIRIRYNGKTYRTSKSTRCESKRNCSLFKRGVCDSDGYEVLPCEAIHAAIHAAGFGFFDGCFKEVKG